MAAGTSTRNRATMEKSSLFLQVESLYGATGYPLRTLRLEDTVFDAHTREPITVITERYLGVLRFCRWSQPGHNQKLAQFISEIRVEISHSMFCTNCHKIDMYWFILERTGSERIETTIRKRQLGFAGALVRQGDSRLSKRVMFGRLAVQGPKRGGRPATSWVDCLQKNLEDFGAVLRKGKGRKWVVFGVVVKDGRDWMTAAKNVGKWHRGVERGAEALDSAWRRADLRQSNVQRQREVSEVAQ